MVPLLCVADDLVGLVRLDGEQRVHGQSLIMYPQLLSLLTLVGDDAGIRVCMTAQYVQKGASRWLLEGKNGAG